MKKNGDSAYIKLKDFFSKQKDVFYKEKIAELIVEGENKEDAINKARQGWVSVIGRALEKAIETLIEDFCFQNQLKIVNDKALKSKQLKPELDY